MEKRAPKRHNCNVRERACCAHCVYNVYACVIKCIVEPGACHKLNRRKYFLLSCCVLRCVGIDGKSLALTLSLFLFLSRSVCACTHHFQVIFGMWPTANYFCHIYCMQLVMFVPCTNLKLIVKHSSRTIYLWPIGMIKIPIPIYERGFD